MMGRLVVAAHLTATLAGHRVVPYLHDLDGINKPTVVVYGSTVARGTTPALYASTVEVWVLTGHTTPSQAENALDASLEAVLDALDQLDTLAWSEAVRSIYQDKFHGWQITCTIQTQKE